jgi:hypothetical protein
VIAVIDISGLILIGLTRLGLIYQASSALILLAWATITVLAVTGGGIVAPEATAYFMVVFASGFLLGEKAGILTGLVCILTGFSLVMSLISEICKSPDAFIYFKNNISALASIATIGPSSCYVFFPME